MSDRSFILLISTALVLSLALPAAADDKQVPESTAVDTAVPVKSVAPESLGTGEQPQSIKSYDNFIDENKNGIDDKFEKAERGKVKVQRIQLKSKPTKIDKGRKKKEKD
jgi:hypothetical protein